MSRLRLDKGGAHIMWFDILRLECRLLQILTVETVETVIILREAITMATDQVSLRMSDASLHAASHSKCLQKSVESARILVAMVMDSKWKYRTSEIAERLRL